MPCWRSWGQTVVGGSEEAEGRAGGHMVKPAWDGEAPRHEQGADGAGLGCREQALALGWWQGWVFRGWLSPCTKCFCFSPFSNEDPPALLLAHHRDVLHPQVLTQVPVFSVPWATSPATWAVLLLSTPQGAAGGVVPHARLSLCIAGDKARLLGGCCQTHRCLGWLGAVKCHGGLGRGWCTKAALPGLGGLVELGSHCPGSHSLQWGNTTGHRDAPSSAASSPQSMCSWGHSGHPWGFSSQSLTLLGCAMSPSAL